MNEGSQQSTELRTTIWLASLWGFGLAVLNTAFTLFAKWAINAKSLGAHDMGLALALAFSSGVSMWISFIAIPVFILSMLGAAFLNRKAALWFAAAAVISAVPALMW